MEILKFFKTLSKPSSSNNRNNNKSIDHREEGKRRSTRLDRYNGLGRGNGAILGGRQLGGFSLTGEYSKGKR